MSDSGSNSFESLSLAMQSFGMGAILAYVSLIHVSAFGASVSLCFLPVVILFFWPPNSRFGPSIWAALSIGLLQDLMSGGPLGLWTLIYTILFVLIDPTVRRPRGGLWPQWALFCTLIGAAVTLYILLGWASVGDPPDYWALGRNALAVIFLFPAIYRFRKFVYQISGREDRLRIY